MLVNIVEITAYFLFYERMAQKRVVVRYLQIPFGRFVIIILASDGYNAAGDDVGN